MTQAELGALELTAIHLGFLVLRRHLVAYDKRAVRIIDLRLAQVGDFDPRYLHLGLARADGGAQAPRKTVPAPSTRG
jgi:hypothetical protein